MVYDVWTVDDVHLIENLKQVVINLFEVIVYVNANIEVVIDFAPDAVS